MEGYSLASNLDLTSDKSALIETILLIVICLYLYCYRATVTVSLFADTAGAVFHMEEDLEEPGNVLLTDILSVKTTDGMSTSVIVGSETDSGYVDGVGDLMPFMVSLSGTPPSWWWLTVTVIACDWLIEPPIRPALSSDSAHKVDILMVKVRMHDSTSLIH